jgi:hypothetical protein
MAAAKKNLLGATKDEITAGDPSIEVNAVCIS